MINDQPLRDLVVLVPDADMEFAIRAMLCRTEALGIRSIEFDVHRHVQRDAGCRSDCHNYLRLWLGEYQHALVLFDREGSGRESAERAQLEGEVEGALRDNGWGDRAAVIVIDPELEAWVWSDSSEVDQVLGWTGQTPALRDWVRSDTQFWSTGQEQAKPKRPKEAFDAALRKVGKQHSPSVFEDLAARVSVDRCVDPAFRKFKSVLQGWFARQFGG